MRILYLHGFASGPSSTKGVAFERYFAERGHTIERVNLRVPSFERLRVSAMIETVRTRLDDATVIIGSSLGGLTAARVAEDEPRVRALVLLAPAFNLAQRWREMLGAELVEWERTGWRQVTDYTTGQPARVDFGFLEEAERLDVGLPRVTCPTLILHGRGDEVVPIQRSRDFLSATPTARLIELDDGHELTHSLVTLLAETEQFLEGL